VHAGYDPNADTSDTFGSTVPPIYTATTFAQAGSGAYHRQLNPTVAALQSAIGEVHGGYAVCVPEGKTGMYVLLESLCGPDSRILMDKDVYGGTWRLVDDMSQRWGVHYDFIDMTDTASVRTELLPNTTLILLENPTNPSLRQIDVAGIAVIAKQRGAIVCVDNTLASPVYRKPLLEGAHVVLEATTKYVSGLLSKGGALITRDDDLYAKFAACARSIGAVPEAHGAFLTLMGLQTLHVRMPIHTRNARAVVRMLKTLPAVTGINWPGYGGVVSFHHPDAHAIVARARLFLRATNFGGPQSLISVPAEMTNLMLQGTDAETPADLVRVCCGLEDAQDLVKALYQAILGTEERLRLLDLSLNKLERTLREVDHVAPEQIAEVLDSAVMGETVPELDRHPKLVYRVWLHTL
jgi:cystathionine gamma-synthase